MRVEDTAIASSSEDSRSAVWGDLNGDGTLDLVVLNRGGPNALYLGSSTGFTRLSTGAAATDNFDSLTAALGDVDNDGLCALRCSNPVAVRLLLPS